MGLLRVGKVKRVVHREVARAGSQVGWARRVGARPSDVSKTLNGKRLPVRSILDGVALRKVPAYRQKQPPNSRRLLHASEVVDLMKEEIRRAGNQSGWARMINARQPDVNNALRGRRLPVKAILDALGLEKVVAYEGRWPPS
jgi:DNA-binding transcriptional regulator YdaS (Cro superfamily)